MGLELAILEGIHANKEKIIAEAQKDVVDQNGIDAGKVCFEILATVVAVFVPVIAVRLGAF